MTICGSFKFEKEMKKISEKLELNGNCVLVPIYPTKKLDEYREDEILMLEKAHKEKIKFRMLYLW